MNITQIRYLREHLRTKRETLLQRYSYEAFNSPEPPEVTEARQTLTRWGDARRATADRITSQINAHIAALETQLVLSATGDHTWLPDALTALDTWTPSDDT